MGADSSSLPVSEAALVCRLHGMNLQPLLMQSWPCSMLIEHVADMV